jgi:hypothetical protein
MHLAHELICRCSLESGRTHRIVDYPNDKAAAGTCRDVLVVGELSACDLETVAAWARIVEDALDVVPSHVLDLNLVVVAHGVARKAAVTKERRATRTGRKEETPG